MLDYSCFMKFGKIKIEINGGHLDIHNTDTIITKALKFKIDFFYLNNTNTKKKTNTKKTRRRRNNFMLCSIQ